MKKGISATLVTSNTCCCNIIVTHQKYNQTGIFFKKKLNRVQSFIWTAYAWSSDVLGA
jgi:hypothetical protein